MPFRELVGGRDVAAPLLTTVMPFRELFGGNEVAFCTTRPGGGGGAPPVFVCSSLSVLMVLNPAPARPRSFSTVMVSPGLKSSPAGEH